MSRNLLKLSRMFEYGRLYLFESAVIEDFNIFALDADNMMPVRRSYFV